ncbi:unnamed protein product [Eruca vesicaria subsp. sativa]|uniref:Uncharacterized protein n=1 Tax=Eruca vesicaria subsp. sativa TaxID=29727 RepID=A0ABC8IWM1_ERUVS|nr:unnamed protein product [Eruca vesicaria subsp. sativa]
MEKKVIKIVRNDGKVLEYRKPICVHQILTTMNKKNTKKVTFADPGVEEEEEEKIPSEDEHHHDTGESKSNRDDNKSVSVVRVKIVVRKQELEKVLQGGSVHEMMYQSLEKQDLHSEDDDHLESQELVAKDRSREIVPYHPPFNLDPEEGSKPSARRWRDGSLEVDPPMMQLKELFIVNHFIVSQANPHNAPLHRDRIKDLVRASGGRFAAKN